jgi:hypothetical protein
MEVLMFWLLCGIVGAALLSPHKKAGTGCLAGGLLGPIGILLAWIEKNKLDREADMQRENARAAEIRSLAAATYAQKSLESARDERECPYCAERVLVRAKLCKHCGRDLAVG